MWHTNHFLNFKSSSIPCMPKSISPFRNQMDNLIFPLIKNVSFIHAEFISVYYVITSSQTAKHPSTLYWLIPLFPNDLWSFLYLINSYICMHPYIHTHTYFCCVFFWAVYSVSLICLLLHHDQWTKTNKQTTNWIVESHVKKYKCVVK